MRLLLFLLCLAPLTAKEFTLEEKVGQMLLPHFKGEVFNEEAKVLLDEVKVGGVILFEWANGLKSPSQIKALTRSLHAEPSKLPLLIAIDQEGGRVSHLAQAATPFPSPRIIAKANMEKEAAKALSKELLSLGINWNLAPVIDVNSNPLNPIIGDRSFGDNASSVVKSGKKWLEGGGGVIQTLKHFPGHGDVAADSHKELPVVKSVKEGLVPFYKLAKKSDSVMTGHLLVPEIDPNWCATLSKIHLEGVLRKEIGFKGVIVSDSLVMKGVLEQAGTIEEAALQAILSGCDILCLGGRAEGKALSVEEVVKVRNFLLLAVEKGDLPKERIDTSFKRIKKLKKRLPKTYPEEGLPQKKHLKLARKIMREAVMPENELKEFVKKLKRLEGTNNPMITTYWKEGEEFPSMGIGHFIWMPDNFSGNYEESFPALLAYLERYHYTLPNFLKENIDPPWETREAFFAQIDSPEMEELRAFFKKTKLEQGCFVIENFDGILAEMMEARGNPKIERNFLSLNKRTEGLLAMIDYVHFKGKGISPQERYQNQGWGLADVLIEMEEAGDPLTNFVAAAKQVLRKRVALAPIGRNEERWIPGWDARLRSYLKVAR